jgi:hypothetical protein
MTTLSAPGFVLLQQGKFSKEINNADTWLLSKVHEYVSLATFSNFAILLRARLF